MPSISPSSVSACVHQAGQRGEIRQMPRKRFRVG
jgi:hypothetical protein